MVALILKRFRPAGVSFICCVRLPSDPGTKRRVSCHTQMLIYKDPTLTKTNISEKLLFLTTTAGSFLNFVTFISSKSEKT